MENIIKVWHEIYGDLYENADQMLEPFLKSIEAIKKEHFYQDHTSNKTWYKDAVVYSTYGDLFNTDLNGLKEKLDYIQDLGANCLWLLPILESPMKDAGFDISDYEGIRASLLGLPNDATSEEKNTVFKDFIDEAHQKGIKVIFDIAMNHCSIEHEWFKEARKSVNSPMRDYFIWSTDTSLYKEARIIFKGMCESNWELDPVTGEYYFHRFFEIQPDLNYRNPQVLLKMTNALVNWQIKGVDGFRADAVPYIWKEEGTICENLPKTHKVVQFFRAVLDYLKPGTLLLAEACQPPQDVVDYFGDDNECNGAYHFPVMPRVYKAIAEEKKDAIEMALHPSFTPDIPKDSQWFMFLRCHDELTLEMVSPEERKFIFDYYAKDPSWDFRQGEGISARLADLMDQNLDRILLANSIMFTLLGTPIVFYGDEFAKGNDTAYYDKMYKETGYKDTRYLGRGTIDWPDVEAKLADSETLAYKTYQGVKTMIETRNRFKAFGRGDRTFIDVQDEKGGVNKGILAYRRTYEDESILVLQNLSQKEQVFSIKELNGMKQDLLGNKMVWQGEKLVMPPYGYHWC
ncbi:alpha-amylase family glycosyl hydrolase [Petrocella sp. FN5]|uniref:alpha-amylase family glycosyl hydrolase n=1 Tax=Petrocella sp. FN5 TaxID=3032002 RepID=UPI0023DB673D|nr:alpha-amylase family glycosyl hydrolase [Petrocella sp. FN5]MDF1617137.1 alpha-amylase family glycosyl hydrolase [Petrocella sp. FN5]